MVGRGHPRRAAGLADRSTEWLVREYGRENIAHLRLHGDEQTPHLTGFIVPLDKAGHLNARKWIGGAARCRQQQTDYAAAVALSASLVASRAAPPNMSVFVAITARSPPLSPLYRSSAPPAS